MELTKYKLSQLLTIKNGKDYKHLEQGDIPVFGSGGYMCSVSSYLYDKVSILLPRKGTLSNIQYFNSGKFWTVDTCFYSIVNESLCDPYYLYRYLKSLDLSGYDTGASIPSMTQKTYNGIKVTLPDLPTQHRIASILSAYDNLIENNTRRIRLLEQMAENLYKEWFVRFRFPEYEKTEFDNGLPLGWKVEKLGDWGITLDTGNRPKGGIDDTLSDGIPSLGAESIKDLASYDYSSTKYIPRDFYDNMRRGKNTGNDILLYKDGAYIGKVTLFRDNFPFTEYAINEHVFFISPKEEDYKVYLYFTLHQDAYFTLMQNLNRNAAQPGLSRPDIERVKMVIPSKEVISAFNKQIDPMLSNIFKMANENALLTKQRDLLLPRLMSGKVEVKVKQ